MEKRLVIQFSDGEDIVSGVVDAAREHDIHYAQFQEAEGELRAFQLIRDDYSDIITNPDAHRLDKASGRIRKQKDGYDVDLHLVLLEKGRKAAPLTGELRRGTASGDVTLTLHIRNMQNIIE